MMIDKLHFFKISSHVWCMSVIALESLTQEVCCSSGPFQGHLVRLLQKYWKTWTSMRTWVCISTHIQSWPVTGTVGWRNRKITLARWPPTSRFSENTFNKIEWKQDTSGLCVHITTCKHTVNCFMSVFVMCMCLYKCSGISTRPSLLLIGVWILNWIQTHEH